MIDRVYVRGYETVTQTLRDAFKEAVQRQQRGKRALALKRALGIAVEDEARAARRKASRKK